jgi:hypothetical protein
MTEADLYTDQDNYMWRQGYGAFQSAPLSHKLPRQSTGNPYDPETQPRCHQRWEDGWHYARDEAGYVES